MIDTTTTITTLRLTRDDSPYTLAEYAGGAPALWIEYEAAGWAICDGGQCAAISADADLGAHVAAWSAAVHASLDAPLTIIAQAR